MVFILNSNPMNATETPFISILIDPETFFSYTTLLQKKVVALNDIAKH